MCVSVCLGECRCECVGVSVFMCVDVRVRV